jgi:hypothetical protein
MATTVNIRQGTNYTTYVSDLTALMSTYNNSLCFIESATPHFTQFPNSATDPIGYSYNPVEPLLNSLKSFENSKTYYIQARVPFTLTLPGTQTKLYQWFDILPPKSISPQGGGNPYPNSYKYNIGFDRSIVRTPISACITPTSNRKNFLISTRILNDDNETALYFGLLDEPGFDQTQQQLTHFEPGSSYSVLVTEGATTTTKISVNRTGNTSYLLTDDIRFLTTNSGDYIKLS